MPAQPTPFMNVPWAGHVRPGRHVYIEQPRPIVPNRPIRISQAESANGDTVVRVDPILPARPAPAASSTDVPSQWTFLNEASGKKIGEGSFGVVSIYELEDQCGLEETHVTVKRIKAQDANSRNEARQESELQKRVSQ